MWTGKGPARSVLQSRVAGEIVIGAMRIEGRPDAADEPLPGVLQPARRRSDIASRRIASKCLD